MVFQNSAQEASLEKKEATPTSSVLNAPDPGTCPDGGLKAWSTVLGVWLVQFSTFGYTNGYGVYQDFYVREYLNKYSSSQISWIGSTQLFLALSMGLISGRFFDRGYFYHTMIGGSALFVFCLFMLSLAQPQQFYQVYLAQGLGIGIATGMLYTPSLAVISHHFNRRRPIAMGIAASGSGLGGMLHPVMLNQWIHNSLGYHKSVLASAGLNAGLLLIALALMRTRIPPGPSKNTTTAVQHLKNFYADPPYVFTVAGTFLLIMGVFFPIFYLQLQAIQHGMDATLAFYTLTLLNGASVVGRIVPNLIVNRFGVFNVVIPCCFACAVLIFCDLAIQSTPATLIFAILFGFFNGACIGLSVPMIASLAKTPHEVGVRLGMCFAVTGVGALIGTPISGALLTTRYIWWRPIVFSGTSVLAGTFCYCAVQYLLVKRRKETKA